jgi:S-disulfanyl-L-cysteine oxidoreductase SoxD
MSRLCGYSNDVMKFNRWIPVLVLASSVIAQTSHSTAEGISSQEQILRGKALYADHCFECHGRTLTGGGETRPIAGDRFLTGWEGTTVLDLFDRVRNTMPFLKPGTLSRQQTADIVAFVLYFNGFPVGSTELSTRAEVLQDIRIDLPKR